MTAVPTIDLQQAHEPATLRALDAACRDHGFFLLKGHGEQAVVDDMWQASANFFSQSRASKAKLQRTEEQPLGYYDRELTKRKRDQKEVFDFTYPDKPINQWPEQPNEFTATMEQFYHRFSDLSATTLQLVYRALQFCENENRQGNAALLQADSLPLGDPRGSNVRLNYYPVHDPLAAAEQAQTTELGDMALHPHTDPGMITLLLQDATGGLQTLSTAEGWIDVPADPSTVVVNLGDCMQVWTNDAYRAAAHRVTPLAGRGQTQGRYSTPYFFNPQADAVLEPLPQLSTAPPRYRPFTWREFIQARMDDNFADLGEDDTQISRYRIAA